MRQNANSMLSIGSCRECTQLHYCYQQHRSCSMTKRLTTIHQRHPNLLRHRRRHSQPGLAGLADFLGMCRFYREVFDPYSQPTEVECTGDILDDLGDIYRDLVAGLSQWRDGNSGEALWAWRFTFESHWGEHATSALRALFAFVHGWMFRGP